MRWTLRASIGLTIAGATVAAAQGCGGFAGDDCESQANCVNDDASDESIVHDGAADHVTADGGSDGGNDADDSGDVVADADAKTCDPEASPKSDGCVVTEGNGVFVAPTGNDT